MPATRAFAAERSVRLPFIYHLIEDDANPYILRGGVWQYIDEALSQAESRGMYVILDGNGSTDTWAEIFLV